MSLRRFLIFKNGDEIKKIEFSVDYKNDKVIIDYGAFWRIINEISSCPYEYLVVSTEGA